MTVVQAFVTDLLAITFVLAIVLVILSRKQ